MKAMILGATGLLGKALVREWIGDDIVGLSSRDVDIRDSEKVRKVTQQIRPDWVVLAAAYTDVDGCESNRDLAFAVNRDGATNVAKCAKESGAKLLFLSSDYVFDGRHTSPYEIDEVRNPPSIYGRSKAEAEVQLLEMLSRHNFEIGRDATGARRR
jgi:dTDP-4-dehydrorhamnose reductase